MRLNKNGQSALEYTLLATIILLGIVVGGPFVQRSVQGYLRGLDDSVKDSSREELMQAGVPTPTPSQNCHCTPTTGKTIVVDGKTYPDESVPRSNTEDYYNMITTWNKGACGVGNCPGTQRYYYRSCSPMKCGQEEACLPDLACCTPPTVVGCGSGVPDSGTASACPNGDLRDAVPERPEFPTSQFKGICRCKSKGKTPAVGGVCPFGSPTTPTCAVGERLYKVTCPDPQYGVFTPFNKDYDPNRTADYFACLPLPDNDLSCLPSCFEEPFPQSTSCNRTGTVSHESDNPLDRNDRRNLINETRLRQITNTEVNAITTDTLTTTTTITSPASTCSSGDLPCLIKLLYSNGAPPATAVTTTTVRLLSQYGEDMDVMKKDAYRDHYVYMEKRAECQEGRLCERKCPGGYVPNVSQELGLQSNETCIHMACWYGSFLDANNQEICPNTSKDLGTSGRICASKRGDPKICTGNNYENDTCDYLLICLGGDESTLPRFMSRANNVSVYQLTTSTASCDAYYHKILNKNWTTDATDGYCYKYTAPQGTPAAVTSQISPFSCNNGILYMTVFGCNAPDSAPGGDIILTAGG